MKGWKGSSGQKGPALDDDRLGPISRAESLLKTGNWQEAADTVRPVLDHDPEHLGALEVLARALWRLGDLEGVLPILRKLSLIFPYEPGYFLMQGQVLRLVGREWEADKAFRRFLDAQKQMSSPDSQMPETALGEWGGTAVAEMPVAEEHEEKVSLVAVASPAVDRMWPN